MNKPDLDIILPTYQHADYIRQTLDQVLEQRTEFTYRLLIGDDYSLDGTRDILRSYRDRHPEKLQLFLQNKNHGVKKNINGLTLYRSVRAQYVAMLDGDDLWTNSEKLQKQVDILEKDPSIAGVFHDARIIDEKGEPTDAFSFPTLKRSYYDQEAALKELGSAYHTSSLVFRSECLEGLETWAKRVMNDLTLDLLITEKGYLYYLPEKMSAYRIHSKGDWQGKDHLQNAEELFRRYRIYLKTPHLKKRYGDFLKERLFKLSRKILKFTSKKKIVKFLKYSFFNRKFR